MTTLMLDESSPAKATADAMDRLADALFANPRTNVVPLRNPGKELANDLAMRDAIRARCEKLHLSSVQTDDALNAAEAERAFGGSRAAGYRAGCSKAERIAATMKTVRTRYGTRPDDEGPRAA